MHYCYFKFENKNYILSFTIEDHWACYELNLKNFKNQYSIENAIIKEIKGE